MFLHLARTDARSQSVFTAHIAWRCQVDVTSANTCLQVQTTPIVHLVLVLPLPCMIISRCDVGEWNDRSSKTWYGLIGLLLLLESRTCKVLLSVFKKETVQLLVKKNLSARHSCQLTCTTRSSGRLCPSAINYAHPAYPSTAGSPTAPSS